jgi:TPR repeat protein
MTARLGAKQYPKALHFWFAVSFGCGGPATQSAVNPQPDELNGLARCEDYAACELACQEKRGDGCTELARMFESGRGAPQNIPRAAEIYAQACRMKSREACAHLALMYEVGLGVDRDLSFAAYWYETACALEDSWSCSRKRRLSTAPR